MAQTLHSQNPLERVLAIKDSSLRQPEEHPTIVPAVGAALRGIAWTSQQPFLYFAIPATGLSGSSDTITLGAGNIWFQDNYFASGTPAAGYVGLKIASGAIHYAAAMNLSQDPIIAPAVASAVLTVTCKLAPPADVLDPTVAIVPPVNVVFTFSQSGVGTLISSDSASITLYSTSIKLARPTTSPPASYNGAFLRVHFPFSPDHTSLALSSATGIAGLHSDPAIPVPISAAGWDLPITAVTTSTGSPTPASQLVNAKAGSGGITLQLGKGLQASFLGTSIDLGATVNVLIDPLLGLVIAGAVGKHLTRGPKLGLWDANSTISLDPPPNATAFRYVKLGSQETWAILAQVTCRLDQPRNVNNDRMYFTSIGAASIQNNGEAASGMTISVIGLANAQRTRLMSGYAIKNLLMKADDPDNIQITGLLSSVTLPSFILGGSLKIASNLRYVLPFLPDPYTTNIQYLPGEAIDTGSLGTITTTIGWSSSSSGPTFPTVNIAVPPGILNGIRLIDADPVDPAPPALTTVDQAAISSQNVQFEASIGNRQVLQLLGNCPTLLDLSSNVAQFGVAFTSIRTDAEVVTPSPFSVSNLLLSAPATDLGVMTLPAVQWEPIVTDPTDESENPTPPATKFPTPLYFPDSGPTTVFGQNSVTLTPIAPRYVIDELISSYNVDTGTPTDVSVRFTLPSGIISVASLHRSASRTPLFFPASLGQVQPAFSDNTSTPPIPLSGGDQISIRAPHRLFFPIGHPSQSPSFPGSTYQLQNGLTSVGAAATPPVSAVGDTVDATFNKQFGPQGSAPAVPVLRADFSGWGESMFSDWIDPTIATATSPGVSKARFDVITGRTVAEVVQVFSDMYAASSAFEWDSSLIKYRVPCAVRVVATATITRLNSGVMLRRTNWVAISNGYYKFMNPTVVSHPGVIQGMINVINIYDTGERITTVGKYGWAGVTYDCTVVVENPVTGLVGSGIPCKGLLGYVQINSPGTTNSAFPPADYADLVSQVGAKMTASLDCAIDIKLTSQIMHISHLGPSVAINSSGTPEFPMVASGSLKLNGGVCAQWSFTKKAPSDQAPQAVDAVAGVPLIRQGPISSANPPPAPPNPAAPYQFADGVDMFVGAGTPQEEYSLIYATGSQRVAFRRPKIEDDGLNRITSVTYPLLADMFALGTSTGSFPAAQVCLPLVEPSGQEYYLQISSGGNLKLSLNPITIPTDGNTRVIASSKNYTNTVYASRSLQSWAPPGTPAPPTVVNLAINTAESKPWSISVTNLTVASSIDKFGEMHDFTGSLSGDSDTPTALSNTALVFGPGLQPVQKLIEFLKKFGPMVPMDVHMTNEWGFQATLGCDFMKLLQFLGPPASTVLPTIIDELSLHVGVTGTLSSVQAVVEADAVLKVQVSFGNIIIIFKCTANFGSDGSILELDAGGGLGVGFALGPFEAEGYIAQTMDLQIGLVYGVGTSVITKAEVIFIKGWLSIEVDFEAKGCLIDSPCPAGNGSTIWCYFQITIGLEITVFSFIQIDFQVQTEWDKAMENPAKCPLIHA